MKIIDYGIMVIGSLLVGAAILSMAPTQPEIPVKQDTVITHQDTVINVKGKKAIIIGDSHSASFNGWAQQVCVKTGMTFFNMSVSSKNTTWMLTQVQQSVHEDLDYCFIYGGANDWDIKLAVKNIQSMVDFCNNKGVKAIVIVGFDAENLCKNKSYGKRYGQLQDMLVTSITGAQVLDTRKAVVIENCIDDVCHMNKAGHVRLANEVIKLSKLQIIK